MQQKKKNIEFSLVFVPGKPKNTFSFLIHVDSNDRMCVLYVEKDLNVLMIWLSRLPLKSQVDTLKYN